MATERNFDLFACKLGDSPDGANAVQLVGPGQLDTSYGHPLIAANNDGVAGEAALDKGPFFCRANIDCQDVSTFAAVLAAFEAATAGRRALMAETKEVGASTVADILIKRAKLISARLSLIDGSYAGVSYGFRSDCDPASDSQDDEISFVRGQTKTATIGAGKRTYRLVSSIHGGSIQAGGCLGVNLDVTGQAPSGPPGDGLFGEMVDVAGWVVRCGVRFRDHDVNTLLVRAQQIIAAAAGNLVMVARQQGGGASSTITLANCQGFEVGHVHRARDYAEATLQLGCAFVSGTTPYTLATGANKVITMA